MQTIHDWIIHIDLQYVKGFGMFPQQAREIPTRSLWVSPISINLTFENHVSNALRPSSGQAIYAKLMGMQPIAQLFGDSQVYGLPTKHFFWGCLACMLVR